VWRDFIDMALDDPELSDFQRKVLSDYQVTYAEYVEARHGFAKCMADLGWDVDFPADITAGGYRVSAVPGSGNETVDSVNDVDTCSTQFLSWVEQVFIGMLVNPNGDTPVQQIRACYEREGVPDGAGLSDDAFEAMLIDPNYQPSTSAAKLCYWDADGSLGLTEADAEELDANKQTITVRPSETPPR